MIHDCGEPLILELNTLKNFKLSISDDLSVHQLNDMKRLNITTKISKVKEHPPGLRNLVIQYKYQFEIDKIGKITTETFKIRVTQNASIFVRPYKTSADEQLRIDTQIQSLLNQGIISPSTSEYSFPVVMVKK